MLCSLKIFRLIDRCVICDQTVITLFIHSRIYETVHLLSLSSTPSTSSFHLSTTYILQSTRIVMYISTAVDIIVVRNGRGQLVNRVSVSLPTFAFCPRGSNDMQCVIYRKPQRKDSSSLIPPLRHCLLFARGNLY